MQTPFKGNTYITPESARKYKPLTSFGMCLRFYIGYLAITIKSRSLAIKGDYDGENWVKCSIWIFNLIEKFGGRFHIEGLDNLRNTAGNAVVIVSNHMSTLETMIYPGIIRSVMPISFVMKESLLRGKIVGPVMRATEPVAVKRENPREDLTLVLEQGSELLKKGRSVVIFPQSTRSESFIPEKFNSLGVKLARKAGVKILPAALKTDFWGNGKLFRPLSKLSPEKTIHIKFGKPIEITGTGTEQHHQTIEFITSNLAKWND